MINVIKAIEEKLQNQKNTIYLKDLQIEDLKGQIAQAEKEIKELKGEKTK